VFHDRTRNAVGIREALRDLERPGAQDRVSQQIYENVRNAENTARLKRLMGEQHIISPDDADFLRMFMRDISALRGRRE
jgi:hypothetical protein